MLQHRQDPDAIRRPQRYRRYDIFVARSRGSSRNERTPLTLVRPSEQRIHLRRQRALALPHQRRIKRNGVRRKSNTFEPTQRRACFDRQQCLTPRPGLPRRDLGTLFWHNRNVPARMSVRARKAWPHVKRTLPHRHCARASDACPALGACGLIGERVQPEVTDRTHKPRVRKQERLGRPHLRPNKYQRAEHRNDSPNHKARHHQ